MIMATSSSPPDASWRNGLLGGLKRRASRRTPDLDQSPFSSSYAARPRDPQEEVKKERRKSAMITVVEPPKPPAPAPGSAMDLAEQHQRLQDFLNASEQQATVREPNLRKQSDPLPHARPSKADRRLSMPVPRPPRGTLNSPEKLAYLDWRLEGVRVEQETGEKAPSLSDVAALYTGRQPTAAPGTSPTQQQIGGSTRPRPTHSVKPSIDVTTEWSVEELALDRPRERKINFLNAPRPATADNTERPRSRLSAAMGTGIQRSGSIMQGGNAAIQRSNSAVQRGSPEMMRSNTPAFGYSKLTPDPNEDDDYVPRDVDRRRHTLMPAPRGDDVRESSPPRPVSRLAKASPSKSGSRPFFDARRWSRIALNAIGGFAPQYADDD